MSRPARGTHGEYGYARYHKCHCTLCKTAVKAYAKKLRFDQAHGVTRRVSAEPARAHVQHLMDLGATLGQIHKGTGCTVTRSQILRLIKGDARNRRPAAFLFRETSAALMALRPEDVFEVDRLVDSVGIHRRIRALNRMGFTCEEIGRRLGLVAGSQIYHFLYQDQVMVSSVQKIAALYDELAGTEGPHEGIRWKGIRLGWPPPLAWDEDAIDDPEAEPNWEWVLCAGPECMQHVAEMGLCRMHFDRIKAMGRLSPPGHFRNAVLRHCQRMNFSRRTLREDLTELQQMGYTLEMAAARLKRRRSAVEAVWYTTKEKVGTKA